MPGGSDVPVVFLDVDGPLIPFGATTDQMPDGYPTFGRSFANPLLDRVDPALGHLLHELPGDLVWATTWGDDANAALAPLLGLDRLPVVPWPPDGEVADSGPRGVHWKTAILLEWARGRPFVWIDDEIAEADRWYVEATHPAPTLLHSVDHRVGLTPADVHVIGDWLRAVRRSR